MFVCPVQVIFCSNDRSDHLALPIHETLDSLELILYIQTLMVKLQTVLRISTQIVVKHWCKNLCSHRIQDEVIFCAIFCDKLKFCQPSFFSFGDMYR